MTNLIILFFKNTIHRSRYKNSCFKRAHFFQTLLFFSENSIADVQRFSVLHIRLDLQSKVWSKFHKELISFKYLPKFCSMTISIINGPRNKHLKFINQFLFFLFLIINFSYTQKNHVLRILFASIFYVLLGYPTANLWANVERHALFKRCYSLIIAILILILTQGPTEAS